MRSSSRLPFFVLSLLAAACSAGDETTGPSPAGPGAALGEKVAPIIGGKADTAHDAVFALVDTVNGTACSGTVFQVDAAAGVAWLITAAHCVLGDTTSNPPLPASKAENLYVIQGTDYNAATSVAYQVLDYKVDPQANPPSHDYCVIQFGGASAQVPTIPLLTPALDNLKTNSAIEEVGFGVTANDPNNTNSLRYYFDTKLANAINYQATSTLTLASKGNGTTGVACHGDSGGPWLYSSGGQQYVAAVDSIGDCASGQVGARISPVVDSFINPYVAQGPIAQTCTQCENAQQLGQGTCAASLKACAGDAECDMLLKLCGCTSTDDTCVNTCFKNHPSGHDLYVGILDCLCFDGCSTQCATDALCQKTKCGFQSSVAACETCLEGSCCAEDTACWGDKGCHECADRATPDPSCAQNALYQAYETCRTTTCAGSCTPGGAGGSGGAGGASAAGGAGGSDATGGTGAAGDPTGGAGASAAGSSAAGSSAAGSSAAGSGGSSSTGGSGTAGASGGATVGGGGKAAGAAAGAAGKAGNGAATGGASASAGKAGGPTSGTGGSKAATGGAASTTGGSDAGATSDDAQSSDSSGGCSVPAAPARAPSGGMALLGLALAWWTRRRRTA